MGGPAAYWLCRTEKKSDLILDLKLVRELQVLSVPAASEMPLGSGLSSSLTLHTLTTFQLASLCQGSNPSSPSTSL